MNGYQTWIIVYTDENRLKDVLYCKKDEIEKYITLKQYRELDHIEVMNRRNDKVKHRPIKKEEI